MAVSAFFFFAIIVLVAVAIRLAAGSMDKQRIHDYLGQRGSLIESMKWRPFGRGWFGEQGERIYDMTFRDVTGARRSATVKTSMFSGVYLTEDQLLSPPTETPGPRAPPPPPRVTETELLRRENERLRWELERLKAGRP